MIDVHSHLLYGVDDGSKSFETSVKMLEAAAKDGVQSIILTPHFFSDAVGIIHEKIEKLRPEAAKFNIKLFSGCEYDFSHLSTNKEFITLGEKGDFILVDFCLPYITPISRNILFEQQARGHQIILAHPERLFCTNDLSMLKELADTGIYFQLNAGSFRGNYGRGVRKTAKELLKHGLCHCIASDAHSVKSYEGQITYCRKYIAKHFGTEAEKVFFNKNPERILAGIPLISI